MRHGLDAASEFDTDLPVGSIEAGTNLLVTGPSDSGAREVALRLLLAAEGYDESVLLVSADVPGRSLLERCQSVRPGLDLSRTAIVDCADVSTDEQRRFETPTGVVAGPGDLSAITLQLSTLYETVANDVDDGVRIGLFSVTSLLLAAPYPAVSRFVHLLTGRVIATGDLGVYLLDAESVTPEAIDALEAFCDGRVLVEREAGTGYRMRCRGLDQDDAGWQSVAFED